MLSFFIHPVLFYRFLERMGSLTVKSLRSVKFRDVYVRCDGRGVTTYTGPGGGTINCQFKPPSLWESFYIYPLEVTPSLAPNPVYKVAIESAQFPHVFIRMDKKGMSKYDSSGGGEVNCQYTTSTWEAYFLRKEANGGHSFRNVNASHCFIRMDGSSVTSYQEPGARRPCQLPVVR